MIGLITLGDYQKVIDVRLDKFKSTEHFIRVQIENVSGKLLTPIGRRLYCYFPHGMIRLHRLLASLLIRI